MSVDYLDRCISILLDSSSFHIRRTHIGSCGTLLRGNLESVVCSYMGTGL
jgi:hypothetical protein